MDYKIAALLTCFNRKEKTLSCLSSLFAILPNCDVYLVDDASMDGTWDEVKKQFPKVCLIKGNGNLFWNRGMHLAWETAIKTKGYDYYLWLNDDVKLYPFFFDELLKCSKATGKDCIISGLIEDDVTHKIIYGGYDSNKKLLQATGSLQEITAMNGNVVLITGKVSEKVGILDPKFHHDLGDVDYGLNAIKAGIKVYTTRKAIALGHSNNFCRVRKWNSNVKDRMKKLYLPLGSNPKINFYFRKKHFGILNASVYWIYIHVINIMSDKLVTILWGNLYHDK